MSSVTGTQTFTKNQNSGTSQCQYMSFVINGFAYAIPLSQVAEITPYQELNHMPHTPECVEGLLDLRGQVLPVISLRTRMNLPKKETHDGDSILIIDHQGARFGFLVDLVESVITTNEEHQIPVSQLLEGQDGIWVREILLLNGKVILVLEPASLTRISQGESIKEQKEELCINLDDLEIQLDEGLRTLIAMADPKKNENVVPQIESVVTHTEEEVTKVLERIESMLASTDTIFSGVGRFKQELAMTGVTGCEDKLTELDTVSQDLQLQIFDVMQQLQFQDIVRQKLERVLRHIAGMQSVISAGLN